MPDREAPLIQGKRPETDAGWDTLIATTHAKLVEIDPDYRVSQIKEKFGGLRYYAYPSGKLKQEQVKEFRIVIDAAENESYRTCSACGTGSQVTTAPLGDKNGWSVTMCSECRPKRYEAWKAQFR